MKKFIIGAVAGIAAVTTGLTAYRAATWPDGLEAIRYLGQPLPSKAFFQSSWQTSVKLNLAPDPFVMKSFPNFTPPAQPVTVYLPLYPGATPAAAVTSIGDMGTSMTPNLVDDTVYFRTKAAVGAIESWYAKQLQRVGYGRSGWGGTMGTSGSFIAFTKGKAIVVGTTGYPDINVGAVHRGNETVFKLKASYIIVPPRPADTVLPTDIVKVTLTEGKQTRVVTDKAWIEHVVAMINDLRTAVGGITSCPAIFGGTMPIDATFARANGVTIPVVFRLPCGVRDVTVGGDETALRGTLQLDAAVEGAFQSASGRSDGTEFRGH